MKRYPHSAILTIRAEPEYINGKRPQDETIPVEIVGRYDTKDTRVGMVKSNAKGDEILVTGEFYTKSLPPYKGTVVSIKIPAFGINKPVLDINQFQSHIVISI